jgi:hypothetical protein
MIPVVCYLGRWRDRVRVEVSERLWVKDDVGVALKDRRTMIGGRSDVMARGLVGSATQAVKRLAWSRGVDADGKCF